MKGGMNYNFLPNIEQPGAHSWNNSFLRVTAYNFLAGVTIAYAWEAYQKDGTISEDSVTSGQQFLVPTSDGLASVSTMPMREGYIYALRISTANSLKRGQCFVVAEIITGSIATGFVSQTLIAGYLTTNGTLTYPGTGVIDSTSGTGYFTTLALTTGAGPALTYTQPPNLMSKVTALYAVYTRSAAAGNPSFRIFAAAAIGNVYTETYSNMLPIVSSVYQLFFGQFGQGGFDAYTISAANTLERFQMHPFILLPGDTIIGNLDNAVGADSVTTFTAVVENFVTL